MEGRIDEVPQMSEWSENWWDQPIVALDVETTGLSAEDDKIIEIALVKMRADQVEDVYCTLVQPGRPVGPDSERITGISDKDLEGAPRFEEIAAEVHSRLEGCAVLAYNLAFDRGFIQKALKENGFAWPETAPMLDPLILARGVFPDQRGYKLGLIAKRVGVSLEEAHRASHDAEAAGRVLYAMVDLLPEKLKELLELQSEWAADFARRTSNWRGGGRAADESLILTEAQASDDGLYRMGPAYRYNRDPDVDPLRFIFRKLPTSGGARR